MVVKKERLNPMYTKNPRNHMTSTKKRFNMTDLLEKYYDKPEAQREFFINIRFPQGYVCPDCGCTEYRWLKSRNCMQCKCCSHQTHVLAGTIFQDSKLSFFQIILGLFLFVTNQSGISGTTLANQMGVNVNTSRLFLRKLREACKTDNQAVMLSDTVQLDTAYFGGVDTGGKRGVGSDKQTVGVALQVCNDIDKKSKEAVEYPVKARFCLMKSENGDEVVAFAKSAIKKGTTILADKGKGISVLGRVIKDVDGNPVLNKDGQPINRYGYTLKNEPFDKETNCLKWAHIFISNAKAFLLGIFHGVNLQYLGSYLEEYNWKFNHRTERNFHSLMESLLNSAFQTAVTTLSNLKAIY